MRLILLGNSGLADEVQSLAEELGHEVVARLTTESLDLAKAVQHDAMVLAVGNPAVKARFLRRLPEETRWATLVSPRAFVDPKATLEPGCVVQHGACVMTGCRIGAHTYLNLNVTVGHGTVMEGTSTVNPGANVSGNCHIGDGVLIGTGAQVLETLRVGSCATVGAGAVVTKDVPDAATAVGVPARWKL